MGRSTPRSSMEMSNFALEVIDLNIKVRAGLLLLCVIAVLVLAIDWIIRGRKHGKH